MDPLLAFITAITVLALSYKGKNAVKQGYLSEYFTIDEAEGSATALLYGISNKLTAEAKRNAENLARFVLDPIREALDQPVTVNNWYRSRDLITAMIQEGYNTSYSTTHGTGGTADIETEGNNGLIVRAAVVKSVPFDRIIIEGALNSPDWIHIEYNPNLSLADQRGIILHSPDHSMSDLDVLSEQDIYNLYL